MLIFRVFWVKASSENRRFLNKIEIAIHQYNHQDVIHTFPTSQLRIWLLIKLTEPCNHYLLAKDIITKPQFSLRHLSLWFKSVQINLYFIANMFIIYLYQLDNVHKLFFPVLYSRQASFIYSMRHKNVGLFTHFFHFINIFFGQKLLKVCH